MSFIPSPPGQNGTQSRMHRRRWSHPLFALLAPGIDPDDHAVEGLADLVPDQLCHASAIARPPEHLTLAQHDLPAVIGNGILVGYPDISLSGGPTVLGGAAVGSGQAWGSFLKVTGSVIAGSSQMPITFVLSTIPLSLSDSRTVTARVFFGDKLNVPAIPRVQASSPLGCMTCQGPTSQTDLPQNHGKMLISQPLLSQTHRPGRATKTCQGARIR